MNTIAPFELAHLMAEGEALELIDVRPHEEFNRSHVRGARSIPLRELAATKIVRKRSAKNPAPLFLICRRRMRASLAAGMLAAAGCNLPVVVDGGMELWEAEGLPLVQQWWLRFSQAVRRAFRFNVPHYWSPILSQN